MSKSRDRQAGSGIFTEIERVEIESDDPVLWLKGLQSYTRRWVEQHRAGEVDTWTIVPSNSAGGP